MKNKDGLTLIVCQTCGEHFLVVDPNDILRCGNCKVISTTEKEMFMTFNDFIKIGEEWY